MLDLSDVKGDITTADVMGCQKKIVEKMIDKKTDYTIGLKQNQHSMKESSSNNDGVKISKALRSQVKSTRMSETLCENGIS